MKRREEFCPTPHNNKPSRINNIRNESQIFWSNRNARCHEARNHYTMRNKKSRRTINYPPQPQISPFTTTPSRAQFNSAVTPTEISSQSTEITTWEPLPNIRSNDDLIRVDTADGYRVERRDRRQVTSAEIKPHFNTRTPFTKYVSEVQMKYYAMISNQVTSKHSSGYEVKLIKQQAFEGQQNLFNDLENLRWEFSQMNRIGYDEHTVVDKTPDSSKLYEHTCIGCHLLVSNPMFCKYCEAEFCPPCRNEAIRTTNSCRGFNGTGASKLGHVFEALTPERKKDIDQRYGLYCDYGCKNQVTGKRLYFENYSSGDRHNLVYNECPTRRCGKCKLFRYERRQDNENDCAEHQLTFPEFLLSHFNTRIEQNKELKSNIIRSSLELQVTNQLMTISGLVGENQKLYHEIQNLKDKLNEQENRRSSNPAKDHNINQTINNPTYHSRKLMEKIPGLSYD